MEQDLFDHVMEIPFGDDPDTATAWVTVGFNNDPDPANQVKTINTILTYLGAEVITERVTVGEWQGWPELGHGWLVSFPLSVETELRNALAHAAGRHHQEAIGFVGTSGGETLIKGIV